MFLRHFIDLKKKWKSRIIFVGFAFLMISNIISGLPGLIGGEDFEVVSKGDINLQYASLSRPIIADHSIVNRCRFDQIPVSAIEQAKSTLHIAYGHTSHGSQLIEGMIYLIPFKEGLGGTEGLYDWNDGPLAGALDIDDYAFPNDVGYAGWNDSTKTYLDDPSHADVNVVIWSWCGQVNDYYDQTMINHYLGPMSQLEAEYPNVKFVYMTGHLEGEGTDLTPGTVYYSNEQIRKYCKDNNKILYDFADIESYNPDGVDFRIKGSNDELWYDPDGSIPYSRTNNWGTEWQAAHTQDEEWYMCYPAHTEAINGNMKAYAAWWLWARLAGWVDPSEIPNNNEEDNPKDDDSGEGIAKYIPYIAAAAVLGVLVVIVLLKKR
jgi:hypothetical protein